MHYFCEALPPPPLKFSLRIILADSVLIGILFTNQKSCTPSFLLAIYKVENQFATKSELIQVDMDMKLSQSTNELCSNFGNLIFW